MVEVVERIFAEVSRDRPDLSFELRLWNGREHRYGPAEPAFVLWLRTPEAVTDVVTRGSLGFGEAYMSGELEVEGDLQTVIGLAWHPAVARLHLSTRDKAKLFAAAAHSRNDRRRSRSNVAHHYDLGNEFYRVWLDEGMTYSCAYWDDDCSSLEEAQTAKYEHICRKLCLEAGDSLVDIGCGWGGMLLYAAQHYGVEGVGYTLSTEQESYANERLRRAGLYPQVHVLLQDYREATGSYDKFVSIGMFEHVGREYYGAFFDKVADILKPGGIGVLHTIGKDRATSVDPWITTYIFPGGYLPTLAQIADPMGRDGLVITDVENLRLHYARTLDEWATRFEAHAPEIRDRFGQTFVRMWRFYLNASSAGFKWGSIRVFQATFTRGLRDDLPTTRSHLYQEPLLPLAR